MLCITLTKWKEIIAAIAVQKSDIAVFFSMQIIRRSKIQMFSHTSSDFSALSHSYYLFLQNLSFRLTIWQKLKSYLRLKTFVILPHFPHQTFLRHLILMKQTSQSSWITLSIWELVMKYLMMNWLKCCQSIVHEACRILYRSSQNTLWEIELIFERNFVQSINNMMFISRSTLETFLLHSCSNHVLKVMTSRDIVLNFIS